MRKQNAFCVYDKVPRYNIANLIILVPNMDNVCPAKKKIKVFENTFLIILTTSHRALYNNKPDILCQAWKLFHYQIVH